MNEGEYDAANQLRIVKLSDDDWRVALKKCKDHIKIRIQQKTLFGAHSAANLGGDPIDHYLALSCEKILAGNWEWKDEFSLSEQLIRIANSHISTEVARVNTVKSMQSKLVYQDIESEFYGMPNAPPEDLVDEAEYENRLRFIEDAISNDPELMFILEALKEGKKRHEISDLMDLQPRQFDKLKERLIRTVRNYKPSAQ